MRPRYLLLAGDVGTGLGGRPGGRASLEPAFASRHVRAFVNPHCPCVPAGTQACVLGTLFRHGPAEAVAALDGGEAARLVRTRGDALLRDFWGGWIAAVDGPGPVRVLRDPSPGCPCYCVRGPGYAAFASDAELLVECGLVGVEVDWRGLASHLYSNGVPTARTALRGISELLPGFALEVGGNAQVQEPCWSPWDHARPAAEEPAPAAERLARTIRHCVTAWAKGRGRLLVSVSGGLDSSIVAASLAGASAEAVCLTMYSEDPSGDERPFARALCAHLRLPLVERAQRLDAVDPGAPLAPHLPRPSDRTHALAYEHAHLEVAEEQGATAFVTGNGGDSVFGYSQSAAAAADLYLSEGLSLAVLESLRDVSAQTRCGLWAAAAAAARLARGPRRYRCGPDPLFLHPDVVAELKGLALDHPWLDAPPDALPGKAAHIASILRIQQCFEPGRSRFFPVLGPLMSQLIVETCLGVPSWEWRRGGRDRALARQAFAGDLPPLILERRMKGGPDGFAARVLDAFRNAIRERLHDGHLARHGLIDIAALDAVLNDRRPLGGEQRARILELVAAEAWAGSWLARAGAGRGRQPVSEPPAAQSPPSGCPSA